VSDQQDAVRVDKWLWAARFLKTRTLAADAVKGGLVALNGQRIKPSHDVRAGDRLEITLGPVRRSVVVRGLSDRRGPATEAALLYEETPESIAAREQYREERRLARAPAPNPGGRPTKRDRRRFDAARGERGGAKRGRG
jgi:ribosome-associated heat shock protein Hsp15